MREFKINPDNALVERDRAVTAYFAEISQYPILTPREEEELALRKAQGDKKAAKRLVECNLRFVVSVAKRYKSRDLPFMDLVEEGNTGLILAVERFDVTRGFKLISFAVHWIRQSMLRFLAEHGRIVRLPANRINDLAAIDRAIARFEQRELRRPSPEELSEILEKHVDKVANSLSLRGGKVSLDAPLSDDSPTTMADNMPSDYAADGDMYRKDLNTEIDALLGEMKPRDHAVVTMFFGIGRAEMSLNEIAIKLGMTRERVRQIKDGALKRLRRRGSRELRSFLG